MYQIGVQNKSYNGATLAWKRSDTVINVGNFIIAWTTVTLLIVLHSSLYYNVNDLDAFDCSAIVYIDSQHVRGLRWRE